jgi:exopolysaccharide biosynthesis polyprenyl glycosylphosphotransferase
MMDMACLFVGAFLGIALRLPHEEVGEYVFDHLEGWLLLIGGVLLANYIAGSYRLQYTYSRFNLFVTWMFSILFAVAIVSITSYTWFQQVIGRGVLGMALISYSALSLSLKIVGYRYLFRSNVFLCRTVVIGVGRRAKEMRTIIESEYVIPAHKVVAFIHVEDSDEEPSAEVSTDGTTVLHCKSDTLESLVRSLGVSLIVVGFEDLTRTAPLYPSLKRLRFDGIEVLSPLSVNEIYRGVTPLQLMNEELLMQASLESSLPMVWRLKRLIDIMASIVGMIVFLPAAALTALSIKLSAPREPVLYSQVRVGQFGREFRIHKFRTMRSGAEDETGAVWASDNDSRITPLGNFLRRFRLDEVPQFFNILNGDMSLVGPRPERPEIIERLEVDIPYYRERENITPGLSGWAQIRYPYGNSVEDARRKLEYDLYYMKHLSITLDLQILLSTLRIVVFGKERDV